MSFCSEALRKGKTAREAWRGSDNWCKDKLPDEIPDELQVHEHFEYLLARLRRIQFHSAFMEKVIHTETACRL